MDEDGNGNVDKEEWMLSTRDELDADGEADKTLRKLVYRYSERLYDYADVDRSGVLSRSEVEFAAYLAHLAALRAEMEGQDVTGYVFGDDKKGFNKIDSNGDGAIGLEEFWTAARKDLVAWGVDESSFDQPHTQEWMRKLFADADLDGSGALSEGAECRLASFNLFDMTMRQTSNFLLQLFDVDGSGSVEWPEVADRVDRRTGFGQVRDSVMRGFEAADHSGDGALDIMELYRMSSTILAAARAAARA